ncbi:MAG: hypothetical protein ACYC5K_09185 [Saccharofermentanales bacterium]
MFEDYLATNQISEKDFIPAMYKKLKFNFELLSYIKSFENSSGVCCISQNKMATFMHCSQTLTSKAINDLHETDNMIEKISSGKYKVNHTNVIKFGIYRYFALFVIHHQLDPDFLKLDWKKQADAVGIPYREIQRIYEWIRLDGGFNRFI